MFIELANLTTATGYYLRRQDDGGLVFEQGREEVYNGLHSVPYYPNILDNHAKYMVPLIDERPGDTWMVNCFNTNPDQSILTNRVIVVSKNIVTYNRGNGRLTFKKIERN